MPKLPYLLFYLLVLCIGGKALAANTEPVRLKLYYFLTAEIYQEDQLLEHIRHSTEAVELRSGSTSSNKLTLSREPLYEPTPESQLAAFPQSIKLNENSAVTIVDDYIQTKVDLHTKEWGSIRTELSLQPGVLTKLGSTKWPIGDKQIRLLWQIRALLQESPPPEQRYHQEAKKQFSSLDALPSRAKESETTENLKNWFTSAGVNFDHPGSAIVECSGFVAIRLPRKDMKVLQNALRRYDTPKSVATTLRQQTDYGDVIISIHGLNDRTCFFHSYMPQTLDFDTESIQAAEIEVTPSAMDNARIPFKVEAGFRSPSGDTLMLRSDTEQFSGSEFELASFEHTVNGKQIKQRYFSTVELAPLLKETDELYTLKFYPISRRTILELLDIEMVHTTLDPYTNAPSDPFAAPPPSKSLDIDYDLELRERLEREDIDFSEQASLVYDGTQLVVRQTSANHEKILRLIQRYEIPELKRLAVKAELDGGSVAVKLVTSSFRSGWLNWTPRQIEEDRLAGVKFSYDNGIMAELNWASSLGSVQLDMKFDDDSTSIESLYLPSEQAQSNAVKSSVMTADIPQTELRVK
ncbi:hypothetical protein [Cerasicoccus maritimus]|uniref:hypothetical protein n=1 Tax=Cerasicoccus maritimus TaxID=490089 RepID=UPI002852B2F7|nr:hypothetical protein [Cerasicoccus maritimus]